MKILKRLQLTCYADWSIVASREVHMAVTLSDENAHVARLQGKYAAMVVCWLLGNGCLFSWNSMLTIEDYYVYLFPKYHPSRVLTLVYQPFALGTISILAYLEAKINTRKRNLFGYMLFFICSLLVLILDLATSGKGGLGPFIGICVISGGFGVADAHVQGGMVGDLSFMQPELMQSFLAGAAASGALTSGLRLVTKAAFENSKNGLRKGALLFFAISHFLSFSVFSSTHLFFQNCPLLSTSEPRPLQRDQKQFQRTLLLLVSMG